MLEKAYNKLVAEHGEAAARAALRKLYYKVRLLQEMKKRDLHASRQLEMFTQDFNRKWGVGGE